MKISMPSGTRCRPKSKPSSSPLKASARVARQCRVMTVHRHEHRPVHMTGRYELSYTQAAVDRAHEHERDLFARRLELTAGGRDDRGERRTGRPFRWVILTAGWT
jgi:hypothetical protein